MNIIVGMVRNIVYGPMTKDEKAYRIKWDSGSVAWVPHIKISDHFRADYIVFENLKQSENLDI